MKIAFISFCIAILPQFCFSQDKGVFGVMAGFTSSTFGDYDEEKYLIIDYPQLMSMNIGGIYQYHFNSSLTVFGQLNLYQNGSEYQILNSLTPSTDKISYLTARLSPGVKYKVYKKIKVIGGVFYTQVLSTPKVTEKLYSTRLGFLTLSRTKLSI